MWHIINIDISLWSPPILSVFLCTSIVSTLKTMLTLNIFRSTIESVQFWVHNRRLLNAYWFTATCNHFSFFLTLHYFFFLADRSVGRVENHSENIFFIFQELCSEFRNQVRNGMLMCTRENDPVRGPDGKMHGNKCALCASLLWVFKLFPPLNLFMTYQPWVSVSPQMCRI